MAGSQLLECVPNFSCGQDAEVVRAIEAALRSVRGVLVLDIHSDASHNRSVFTVVGTRTAIQDATFAAVQTATERIDLRRHRGQHPRIGAADVIPFVPIPPTAPTVAVETALEFAQHTANALDLPIYLYGLATLDGECRALPTVRRRGFEWLRTALRNGTARLPDFGPNRVHPTAGACAVGARNILVAFNVNLETPDVTIAESIARDVRASNGGHPGIRALGLSVGGRAQVSMNLFDLEAVNVRQAFTLVKQHAALHDVPVHSSELVGLAPRKALAGASARALRLPERLEHYELEARLKHAIDRSIEPATTSNRRSSWVR